MSEENLESFGQSNDLEGSSSNSDADKDWKVEHDKSQAFIGKQATEIGDLRKELDELKGKSSSDSVDNEANKLQAEKETNPLVDAQQTIEEHKLDWDEFQNDYYKNNGSLSDDMRDKAIKAGIPEQLIDKTIAGFQQTAKEEYSKVADAVGGLDELDAVFGWVAKNFSEEKLNNLKKTFSTELPLEAAQYIVQGLKNEMLANEGKPPSYFKNTGGGTTSGEVFESRAQAVAYLNDPRADYKDPAYDPAYMKKYDAIIARSKKAGYHF